MSCVSLTLAGGPGLPMAPTGDSRRVETQVSCAASTTPGEGCLLDAGITWGFWSQDRDAAEVTPQGARCRTPLEGPSAASSPHRRGESAPHPQGCC